MAIDFARGDGECLGARLCDLASSVLYFQWYRVFLLVVL
jgi:hypothetical protein